MLFIYLLSRMDWDEGRIFVNDTVDAQSEEKPEKLFDKFLRNFREKNIFVYREQLKRNCRLGNYFLIVSLEDLESFGQLATKLKADPSRFLDDVSQ